MMATGANPSIQVGRAADHPTPVTTYGNKWVRRTYQVVATEGTATTGVQFKPNSFGLPGSFFVDKVTVWKLGQNGNGLNANLAQGLLTDLGTDSVDAKDFGTASSLPGITYKVPLGHAKEVSGTDTTTFVTCNTVVNSTALESFVCNLSCWVSI